MSKGSKNQAQKQSVGDELLPEDLLAQVEEDNVKSIFEREQDANEQTQKHIDEKRQQQLKKQTKKIQKTKVPEPEKKFDAYNLQVKLLDKPRANSSVGVVSNQIRSFLKNHFYGQRLNRIDAVKWNAMMKAKRSTANADAKTMAIDADNNNNNAKTITQNAEKPQKQHHNSSKNNNNNNNVNTKKTKGTNTIPQDPSGKITKKRRSKQQSKKHQKPQKQQQ